MSSNANHAAFPAIDEKLYAEGLSKLEYIATHVSISESVDGFSATKLLVKLVGEEIPEMDINPKEFVEWWCKAEAKIRVMKAKALLAELEKH